MASGTVVHLNGHIQPFFFGLSLMICGEVRGRKILAFAFCWRCHFAELPLHSVTAEEVHRNPILAARNILSAQENFHPIHTNFLFMLTVDRLYSIITKKGSTENNNCIKFGSRD